MIDRLHPAPLMVADSPALDLLNTLPMVDGRRVDYFEADEDVVRWLILTGFAPAATAPAAGLLELARALREDFRRLIERRKAGKRADFARLNALLAESRSFRQLVVGGTGSPELRVLWQRETAEEMLGPLADAIAEFMVTADLELVRECEDPTCVLWFYDRTKSHHRRWCSMATCGNRNKVMAFRQRRAAL